jgi:hypothetical protein
LRTAGNAEVSPIVDDNDEFQLDIPEPAGFALSPPANLSLPGLAPAPLTPDSQRTAEKPPTKGRGFSPADSPEEVGEDGIPKEKERRNRVERRKMTDRRFSSLIEEKGSSSSSASTDFDDDYSVGRPQQASSNAGLAKVMIGVAAMALGFKIWHFIKVSGMWDLTKLPEFVAEQMFSGVAIICLIVLALSCMKK